METQPLDQHESLKLSTSSDPHHSHKTLLLGVGALLLIIIGSGMGYYLGSNKTPLLTDDVNNQMLVTHASPTIMQDVSPTNTPSPSDVTANWKSFTSSKHSYVIKYPSTWKIEMPSVTDGDKNQEFVNLISDTEFSEGIDGGPYGVFITVYTNPLHKNLQDLVKDINKITTNLSFTQTTINETKVYKTHDLPSQFGDDTAFFQDRNDNYISLTFSPYPTDTQFPNQVTQHQIYDQMLANFKFTN